MKSKLFVYFTFVSLVGCVTFQPTQGMGYQDFRKMSVQSINGEPLLIRKVGTCDIYMLKNSNRDLAPTNSVARSMYDPNKDYGYVFKDNKLIDTITAPSVNSYQSAACTLPVTKQTKSAPKGTQQSSNASPIPTTISWAQETRNVLSKSKYFVIKVVCTDEIWIKSRNAFFSMGEERGIGAVAAYYQMGADTNPNARQAFSKTPYNCMEKNIKVSSANLEILERFGQNSYIVKIKNQDLYGLIQP